ncbi:hypothetical protein ACFROC_00655 [Nocardia tengchongensis]|uniref:hypothetical protein n=1 Tax=Nocardia tengchongensis TaxID=2055889 RepID=UPI00367E4F27
MGDLLNRWNQLNQQVSDESSKGTLKFDSDVATRLAQLCALMAHGIDQVSTNVEHVTALPDFGTRDGGSLASGHALAQKFINAANDLRDRVLVEHKNILTAMGQTFLSAKVTMESQDRDSAGAFANLLKNIENNQGGDGKPVSFKPESNKRYNWTTSEDPNSLSPGGKGVYVGEDQVGKTGKSESVHYTPEFSDKLEGLHELTDLQKRITGERDSSDVNPERGESLSWNDLYANFGYMPNSSNAVLAASNSWKGFADVLKAEATRFTDGFAAEFGKHRFSGEAAQAAVQSGKDYGAQLSSLIEALNIIGENLRISASWMDKTHWYMPQVDERTFLSKHKSQKIFLTEYNADQTKWNEWYVVGATASSNCIPTLPSVDGSKSPMAPAPAPAKPPGDNPDPNAEKSRPTGDPSGTPGTPSGSPGSPSVPDTKQPEDKQPEDKKPTTPTDKQPTDTKNTDLSTLASTLSTIAQQGVSMVETLAKDGSSLVQSLLSSQQTTPTAQQQLQQLQQQLAALTTTPVSPTSPTSPGGSPSSPGSPGGPSSTPARENPQSKLFPRAGVPSSSTEESKETATSSRAGLATTSATSSGSGTSGMPMGGAGAAGAGQGGGKEHKRPDYLKSAENFAEALGVLPEAVTPVADVEK